jgi:hypothetical protein
MPVRAKRYDNLDAAESVHFSRSLEQVKASAYDTKYPQFRARALIPVANWVDPDAKVITFRTWNQVGLAKIIAGYSDDLPRADVYGTEESATVKDLGDSYGYNVTEIRQSRRDGSQLDQKKANAARRAIEQLQENIAFNGDTTYGLYGLANQPNAQVYVVPNGAGGTATWATKTSDEILADLFGIGDQIVSTTKNAEKPDTLLLPQNQYSLISRKRIDDTVSETILTYFLRTSSHIKNIEVWDNLDGAGSGGTDRMIAYSRNPDVLELIIPREFEQLDGQARNLEIVVPCLARAGGVIAYLPMAIAYGDGL